MAVDKKLYTDKSIESLSPLKFSTATNENPTEKLSRHTIKTIETFCLKAAIIPFNAIVKFNGNGVFSIAK